MNRIKYYYELTAAAGGVMYMEIDAKPKDPKLLCGFLHIEGTVRELTETEYLEMTEAADFVKGIEERYKKYL